MALAFAGARGQGGNALNGLHPCTLPQQAPFAAVRRVSPLCAAFRAGCEVCARQHSKSPRCTDVRKKHKIAIQQSDCDFERRRSGMDELSRFARKRRIWSLCRRRSQHRIWLVAGPPAPCQMPNIGQKPIPTSCERRKICEKINNSAFESQHKT